MKWRRQYTILKYFILKNINILQILQEIIYIFSMQKKVFIYKLLYRP